MIIVNKTNVLASWEGTWPGEGAQNSGGLQPGNSVSIPTVPPGTWTVYVALTGSASTTADSNQTVTIEWSARNPTEEQESAES